MPCFCLSQRLKAKLGGLLRPIPAPLAMFWSCETDLIASMAAVTGMHTVCSAALDVRDLSPERVQHVMHPRETAHETATHQFVFMTSNPAVLLTIGAWFCSPVSVSAQPEARSHLFG